MTTVKTTVMFTIPQRDLDLYPPFRAITLDLGFIIAESAEMGLRVGFWASPRSMMTTCAVSPTFSRTQMNLSDSMVRVEKPMFAALMPMLCSCNGKFTGQPWEGGDCSETSHKLANPNSKSKQCFQCS